MKEQSLNIEHFTFALEVAEALSVAKGKTMPLNVDGAIGALCADLGWPDEIADALFILGRTGGLVAHAREAQLRIK
ncbi:MAG: citrate/2-methylcitrate synthase [Patescibacteria group bacterium]